VLPCGSGKTLLGISIIANLKKSAVIICTNTVSVEQWSSQLQIWAEIDKKYIIRLSGD
jgi:DNA excision repair protein ERCC-3